MFKRRPHSSARPVFFVRSLLTHRLGLYGLRWPVIPPASAEDTPLESIDYVWFLRVSRGGQTPPLAAPVASSLPAVGACLASWPTCKWCPGCPCRRRTCTRRLRARRTSTRPRRRCDRRASTGARPRCARAPARPAAPPRRPAVTYRGCRPGPRSSTDPRWCPTCRACRRAWCSTCLRAAVEA